MKLLHDQHNASGSFVVKATEQRVVKPLVCSATKSVRQRFVAGFIGSSMTMVIRAAAGQDASHGGRQPIALAVVTNS